VVSLGERDRTVLDALTHRVRVLTLEQTASLGWEGSASRARERLRALEAAGWLRALDLLAHPLIELGNPALVWEPGDPVPDFDKLSYRLTSRWKRSPRVHRAFIATRQAAVRLAGHGGRVPRPSEATHDIHLAEVYLALLRKDPKRARRWVSEEDLYSQGFGRDAKLPDAMLLDRGEGPTVVEFGGAYRPAKLRDFHRFFQRKALRYELW